MTSAASQTPQTPWYLDPISMQFGATEGNGVSTEKGVDLRVPYHTPITPLFPGVVRSVATGPYGQEVDVTGLLNGQQVTASYVHLDEALVRPGQPVGLGSELGLSGGQNVGGFHPASPAYSSYPHIEFSLWPGDATPYAGTPYNPMNYIRSVQASQGAVLGSPDSSASASSASASALGGLGGLLSALGSVGGAGRPIINIQPPDIAGGITSGASAIGQNVLTALGVNRLPDLLWRAGLLIVALVLIVVVAQALSAKATQNTVEMVSNSKPVQAVSKVTALAK